MLSATVTMPDGSTHALTGVLSQANHKQRKGVEYRSAGLTLTPRATGRSGRNLCPYATSGCAASCFAGYDRMAWPQNKRVAVARTLLLATDPRLFGLMLIADLRREEAAARRSGVPLVCRLNVASDVPFEREMPHLFISFQKVQFMDYTKDVSRVLDPRLPPNYHLTFSRSERNEADCLRVLAAGRNVTVVFRRPPFPDTFWGHTVVDGDVDDLRFLDPRPCVVALRAKGAGARRDQTGFVVFHPPGRVNFLLAGATAGVARSIPLPIAQAVPPPEPLSPSPHCLGRDEPWPLSVARHVLSRVEEIRMPRPKLNEQVNRYHQDQRALAQWRLHNGRPVDLAELLPWLAVNGDVGWGKDGRPADIGDPAQEAEAVVDQLVSDGHLEEGGESGAKTVRLAKPVDALKKRVQAMRSLQKAAREEAAGRLLDGKWVALDDVLPAAWMEQAVRQVGERLASAVRREALRRVRRDDRYEVRTTERDGREVEEVRLASAGAEVATPPADDDADAPARDPGAKARKRAGKKKVTAPAPAAALNLVTLPVGQLRPNPWNPNTMTAEQEADLAEEVRRGGRPLKPVVVRQAPEGGYEIVDGEYSWKAARRAGLAEVPCEVVDADDFEARRQTIVRNEHGTRDPLRTGRVISEMLDLKGLCDDPNAASQRQFAKEINVSEGTVRNLLVYARAAEVRKHYAPETADETIRGLSVERARLYLSLPADRRDEWLDRDGSAKEAKSILGKAAGKAQPPEGRGGPAQPAATGDNGPTNAAVADEPEEAAGEPAADRDEGGRGGDQDENGLADAGDRTSRTHAAEPARQAAQGDQHAAAGPLSQSERQAVDGVLKAYRDARPPVRETMLAGLAAHPDAVTFFRRMIKHGA